MREVLYEILESDLSSGELLRGLRIKKKMSQDQLSEITGIARPNISAIENGRLEMTYHYSLLLGAALNIHPKHFLFPNDKVIETEEFKKIELKASRFFKKV